MNWLRTLICNHFHGWQRLHKVGPGVFACRTCGLTRRHPAYRVFTREERAR